MFNGAAGRSLACKRGLRQGDPLSPLLFILCANVLFRLIDHAVFSHILPTVEIGDVKLHTLQFADDMLLFFDGSSRSSAVLKLFLDAFGDCSGLKINFHKSAIISINLDGDQLCFSGTSRLLHTLLPVHLLGPPAVPEESEQGRLLTFDRKT